MATTGRRPDPALIQSLIERPAAFDFFQAVRLLEALGSASGRKPLGFDHEPRREAVRLRGVPSLAFPAGEIRDVRGLPAGEGAPPPELRVTFLGFLGAAGVLPQHYTELAVRRVQQKDTAFVDWLDLLLHRTLSLLYRAWRKYRPVFSFEHAARTPGSADPTLLALRALAGIATGGMQERQSVPDAALIYFAGHLSSRRRSASGLASLLHAWLGMPVHVRQFVGRWLPVEAEDQSRLPSGAQPQGRHARLGRSLFLGTRVRDVAGKARIEVGPLAHPAYLSILPGTPGHAQLRDLVRTYVGNGIDCDLEISFERDHLPAARLAGADSKGRGLGRDAWIGDPRNARRIRSEVFPLTNE